MNTKTKLFLLAAVAGTAFAGIYANGQQNANAQQPVTAAISEKSNDGFTTEFFTKDCTWSNIGSNTYFILKPGYQLVYKGPGDAGEKVDLVITVTDTTRTVDGVKTRVVEERESADGKLVEVSRNFYALCKPTNSLFYFGEEVDFYENGKIVDHHGSWLAGKDGAKPGIFMPGTVLLGAKYFEEIAPAAAMDRGELISMNAEVDTPARHFEDTLKVKETTPLEPGAVEFKWHAPGVGLVQDGDLKLVKFGMTG
jgi:hypothetical protein